jgi:glycosyltransferase involved in cell wall biosynthesis
MPADSRPLVTLVLPAYNEAAILEENLAAVQEYLRTLEQQYRFEILIINDGSADRTGEIAEAQRSRYDNVRVVHHPTNRGLGHGFRTGFAHARGDYVVTMDIDLSYSPDHIGALLEGLRRTGAQVVLASPYMKGGRISNVPWLRRVLSVWANRFLSLFAHGNLSTLTCMVRAHDGEFARGLVLRAVGMEVMPESIYKSMILRGRIAQIPAHLDWSRQIAAGPRRRSSMRILRHTFATLLSGFIFRPFMFLVLPGLLLLAFALWTNFWMVMHFVSAYAQLGPLEGDRVGAAIAQAYQLYPHTFVVGLLSLMLAIQLLGLGILALQAKNYFEELFFLGSTIARRARREPEAAEPEVPGRPHAAAERRGLDYV